MEKLSIERFREIKERIAQIVEIIIKFENEELTKEQIDEMGVEQELERFFEEVHSHDLSDIPYEEYEGFYDFGFDFEGTGANLDYEIINTQYYSSGNKYKGCNVRNFKFDEMSYTDDTFDEDFKIKHSEHFFGYEDPEHIIPKEVRDRFFSGRLTLKDIADYNIPQERCKDKISFGTAKILEKIPSEIAYEISKEIDLELLFGDFFFKAPTFPEGEELTTEKVKEAIIDSAINTLASEDITEESYDRILSIAPIMERAIGKVIIIPKEEKDLRERFFDRKLTYADIQTNPELFRNKNFIPKMKYYAYRQTANNDIIASKIYYLIDNYPELVSKIVNNDYYFSLLLEDVDPLKTTEENNEIIKKAINKGINSGSIAEEDLELFEAFANPRDLILGGNQYNSMYYEKILENTTEEKVLQSGIPLSVLSNESVLQFLSTYGFDTIMEFDKNNNGIFSQNNYDFMKKFSAYYAHYGSYPGSTLYKEAHLVYGSKPYTLEELEDIVVHTMFMNGPTDGNKRDESLLSDTDFSLETRLRHPDVFLPEDAPEELKAKYYPRRGKNVEKDILTLEDFAEHPEWADYISSENFEYIFKNIKIDLDIHDFDEEDLANPKNRKYFLALTDGKMISLKEDMAERFGARRTIEIMTKNRRIFDLCADNNSEIGYAFMSLTIEPFETEEELIENLYGTLAYKAFNGKANSPLREKHIEYVKEMIQYPRDYMYQIQYGINDFNRLENQTEIDVKEFIEGLIEDKIIAKEIKYNEDAPEFLKIKHPEIFLDDNAPEELKRKFYTLAKEGNDNERFMRGSFNLYSEPNLKIEDLFNPEFATFLEGKNLTFAKKTHNLEAWYNTFGIEGIKDIGQIDMTAFNNFSNSQEKLKDYLQTFPEKFAKEELMSLHNFESIESLENALQTSPELLNEFNEVSLKYKTLIIQTPGIVINGIKDNFTRESLLEYKDLFEKLPLKNTENYRRDVAERSLFKAYSFLGYQETLKLIQVPEIDSEFLDAVYQTDERIKALYERKYEITRKHKSIIKYF